MATYNATTGITANDTYTFAAPFSGTNYVLYAAGNFGGGTVTLGYIDSEEDFASFKNASNEDVTLTSSGGAIVTSPPSKLLAVRVTGSTGPVIKLTAILYNR